MPMSPLPPAKILVIDDEVGPRESLRILLKKEFQVSLAESVVMGLRLLQEQQPEVVLLDIRMPGMDGLDGLREIRQLDEDVAVLILTGFGSLETAQEVIRRGANDYLKKPFDTREMLETVRLHVQRAHLRRRHRRTGEELRKVNQLLLEQLARKHHMVTMGQRSAEFLHDLRNPLTAVLGYVDLLGEELRQSKDKLGAQWEETSDFLQNIELNLEHCRELSAMWLKLGRKDSQELQVLSLCALLQELVASARPRCLRRRVKLDLVVTGGELCRVEAEHIQLMRAFDNLLGNAVEAVPDETGVVEVRCCSAGQWAEVYFKDNGPGISPGNLPRIFEPYFTTKGKSGNGLGLFITQQVIMEHGGTVTVESRPAAGATFAVRLPLTRKPASPAGAG